MSTSTPVHASAGVRAYEHVLRGILDGVYSGLLTEGGVAAELDCSRTPVREAFLRLESEGMVRLYPKKGALVVPVSAQEAGDVWEARALVEQWAAPRAFARGAEIVPRLRELTEQMRARLDDGDVSAFTEADRTFHEVIVGVAGNDVLTRLYRSLRTRQLCINAAAMRVSRERMEVAAADHARLTDLLEAGDADAFAAAVAAHLDTARRAIGGGDAR
ncbi:GntR family transcriptional regulator [Solicola sp. PLA-1-18]|uniref:GntR family transcriptional regulator n=1 Tax=Solicola sp. PLA-1-18 TaxID=3380532 RepID=UPI003B81C994